MDKELVPQGNYRAAQIPGNVVILASCTLSSGGYRVWIEENPQRVIPKRFQFYMEAPEFVLPVVTDYVANLTFRATDRVESIVVQDGSGEHTVLVEQVPDALTGGIRLFSGSSPFPWRRELTEFRTPFDWPAYLRSRQQGTVEVRREADGP